MKVARIYLRVSTEEQDLSRQDAIVESTKAAGFYVAGIYREKASGARADRAELLRLIADLQPGEVVVAEKIFTALENCPASAQSEWTGRCASFAGRRVMLRRTVTWSRRQG